MDLPPPRLFNPRADDHLLPHLAQIQADCITHDKQLATFLPPLSHVRMIDYWREISSDVEKGRTALIMQLAAGTNGEKEGELMGYVCLMMPITETGPFRGVVNNLMMLDTTIGLPAENVYPKLGWTELGVVPKYGISPEDGRLVDEKFFYKDLRDHTKAS